MGLGFPSILVANTPWGGVSRYGWTCSKHPEYVEPGGASMVSITDCPFNICTNGDLESRALSVLSPKSEITFTNQSWKGDVKVLIPDITKIKKLGFKNNISLNYGLGRLIEWMYKSENFLAI